MASSSPPHLRGPLLTPIPEYGFQVPVPVYSNAIQPSDVEMDPCVSRVPGLPMSYYNLPDNAEALFSTHLHRRPKRKLEEPLPSIIMRSNTPVDVQRKCVELRARFPDLVSQINGIENWFTLHQFFDAVDLWIEGPDFCYFVIHRLGEMNIEIRKDSCAQIISYAQDWVTTHQNRLLTADETIDVLGLISPDESRSQEFHLMRDWQIYILRTELNKARDILIRNCRVPRATMAPYQSSSYIMSPPRGPAPARLSFSRRYSQLVRSEDGPRTSQVYRDHNNHLEGDAFVTQAPQVYQDFNNLMQTQENLHAPPAGPRNNRNRTYSNDTNRGGRGGSRIYSGQYSTPRNSPSRHESSYVHSGARGMSADFTASSRPNPSTRPRKFSGTSNYSNDARNSPFSRRTVSEETSRRRLSNYSNEGRPNNQHARVTSSSSTVVTSAHTSSFAKPNNNGHYYAVGGSTTGTDSKEDLGIADYPYHIGSNGAVTIFYIGAQKLDYDSGLRTVYVGNVPLPLFLSHSFREMMCECGEIENITHLRSNAGGAFVNFCDETAVQKAIDTFNGYPMGNGVYLIVNVPNHRFKTRGYSMSSFSGDNMNGSSQSRGPSGNHGGHGRTHSTNPPRESYRPPIPEMPENEESTCWQPLREISNISPSKSTLQNAAGRAFFQPSTATSSPKKENSPMATPSRSGVQTPRAKQGKKSGHHGKMSSQRTSKDPTPMGSPKRSGIERSSASESLKENLDQLPLEDISQRLMSAPLRNRNKNASHDTDGKLSQRQLPAELDTTKPTERGSDDVIVSAEGISPVENGPKPKSKNKSKKKGNAKSMSNSFTADSSSATVSPIDLDSGSFAGNASTNTSFSAPSSRHPSVVSASRKPKDPNRKAEESASVATCVQTESSEKNKAKNEGQAAPKAKHHQKGTKNRNGAGDNTATSGHRKNPSTSSAMSNTSQRKVDGARASKAKTKKGTAALAESEQNKETPLGGLVVPAINVKDDSVERRPTPIIIPPHTGQVAKSDASLLASPSSMSLTSKSLPEPSLSPQVSEADNSPRLDGQKWPALAPSKSPVTAIADGKPATPIHAAMMPSLTKSTNEKSPDVKKASKSTFPPVAVPRSFESSRSPATNPHFRPPTEDEEGSATWPFVRRFRAR